MSLTGEAPSGGIMPAMGGLGGRLLAALGAGLILLMVVVTCIDVAGRYLFNRPFGGAFEITQLSLGALVFVALPLATRAGAHVEVDLALHLFPPAVQRLLGRIAAVIVALMLVVFAFQLGRLGLHHVAIGAKTASLGLPLAPLSFLGATSCAVSAMAAFRRLA